MQDINKNVKIVYPFGNIIWTTVLNAVAIIFTNFINPDVIANNVIH